MRYKIKIEDCRVHLRIRLPWGDQVDEQELDRFQRAGFRGCFQIEQRQKRGLRYSGPLGKTLREYLQESVRKADFLLVLMQLVFVVQRVERAGFDVKKFVLSPDCIFINENTKEIQVMYVPSKQTVSPSGGLKQFLRELIIIVNPHPEQGRDYLARLNLFLNEMKGFDSTTFTRWMKTEDEAVVRRAGRSIGAVSGFMTDKQRDYYQHVEEKYQETDWDEMTGLLDHTEYAQQDETGLLSDEMTGLLWSNEESGFDETGLLSDANPDSGRGGGLGKDRQDEMPMLVRIATGEEILIEKPVFRIGKEKSYVDYFVVDNPAVSRSHADLVVRGGQCFIKDLNSKNGTKINGQIIAAYTEVPLLIGDYLSLGNEEFLRKV